MTLVKICGIQEVKHAQIAAQGGADAIGFVFAPSKRQISVNKAAEIAKQLPSTVNKIGVFVNASKQELETTAHAVGLDFVQLHGDETPEFCEQLDLPYIKSFRIQSEEDLQALNQYDSATYFLLDSASGPYRGGNGTQFDWSILDNNDFNHEKFILAGGLNPDNVQQAIKQTQPMMVDVSSGVETDGQKDETKINQFINLVKERSTCHTHNQI
ncbi:phosphoribosylanthranilate isomerase [Alkalibacillus aidingensis]|uniref:phosphoribosylanthranilate isomerase n=1 Tax=Alkalibacillus aidingensis TaxID=2747607 RepID=UPI00166093AD|nr:phosphoribosylanthranilate isomerase [Alkalibacillus aidingensis]